MSSLLIYIHGFNSSHLSQKAQQMVRWCHTYRPDINLEVPRLACYPAAAQHQLEALIEPHLGKTRIGLVGSSLGGYLASWLNEKYGVPAVLINPAVFPYLLLSSYLGPQKNPYTGEEYVLEAHHMDELKMLDTPIVKDESSIWLLQQQDDEVLDYREAVKKYQWCKKTLEKGGSHAFEGFERYPADIIKFLGL